MVAKPFAACWWTFLILSAVLCGAGAAGRMTGTTHALIVGGIARDPNERAAEDRVVNGLRTHLVDKAGVEASRVVVLVPEDSSCRDTAGQSTADRIRHAIKALAAAPEDRFVFYYVGQANAVADKLRFNLPGPDITHEDLAALLAGVKVHRQLIVLDCPCAALAAEALAGGERVILCASTAKQAYATRFGLHFVPALTRAGSDADHDGRISVLEAFTVAAREIEQWYRERKLLPTETPGLEDDGDGVPGERPWRYEVDGEDGRRAAAFVLATTAGGHDG